MNDMAVIETKDNVPMGRDQHDMLMMKVIETGNIEVLERFIALRASEEKRQAEKEFDLHFAQMQGEFESAHRVKEAYDYKYAPIEELQRTYGPVISKHGFSYRWSEDPLEDGGKRVTMTISGYGASRNNSFDVPKMDPVVSNTGKVKQNPVQVKAVMTTYGRRYSFIAGFGVIIEDEDPDGIPEGTGTDQANNAAALQSCGNIQELMASWKNIYQGIKNDPGAMRYLTGIKDECKRKLS